MRCRLPCEWAIGLAGSLTIHGLWLAGEANARGVDSHSGSSNLMEVSMEAPPAPREAPAASKPEPEPAEKPIPAQASIHTSSSRPIAAHTKPAPAQAGKTLTAPEEGRSEVADFTVIQGDGNSYAGGTTAEGGTSASAVQGLAGGGSRPPIPAAPRPTSVSQAKDLSRPATPTTGDWSCSHLFPSDPEAGNAAVVVIVATVRPDGTPRAISILKDPGHSFGAAARMCALGQRYMPALDRDGQPTTGNTPPVSVHFMR